jgi:hypothetical protein
MLEAPSKLERIGDYRLALAGWFSPVTLKQEIEKSAWAGRVDFLGRLSRDELTALLAAGACRNRGASSRSNLNQLETHVFEYKETGCRSPSPEPVRS